MVLWDLQRILVLLLGAVAIVSSDSLNADEPVLRLSQSTDGVTWEDMPMDFSMIAPDGSIRPGALSVEESVLYRLEIAVAPPLFLLIPAGTFTMGSPNGETGRGSLETAHAVTLTRAFYLQTTEVTWSQWNAVRNEGPARGYTDLAMGQSGNSGDAGETHPVTGVSSYDAMKWLNLRSELEGMTPCYSVNGAVYRTGETDPSCNFNASGYRLPTEAEWEYACRAGTTTALYNGHLTHVGTSPLDPNLDQIGWYLGNSHSATHPVGGKEPNSWGLYDMSGNVWEWCWDWYTSYTGAATNPTGPATGIYRVIRGGGYYSNARNGRSAFRGNNYPETRAANFGFRPARNE